MTLPSTIIATLMHDPLLPVDFAALCDVGGRRAGTGSERAALDLVQRMGQSATGHAARVHPVNYDGWEAVSASLALIEDGKRTPLTCLPLIRSAATAAVGIEAEVVVVGRGTPDEFQMLGDRLRGRFALVRHEYMFAAGHIHRRHKYAAAQAAGAAGFLIAGPLPTGAVAGSTGRGTDRGIPAFGISPEAAARLSPDAGYARLHATLITRDFADTSETVVFDMLGQTDEWVVLSAHVDGHDPAESAIDNASGVAVAIAVARALAPYAGQFRRGLRLALFSVEEWALTGSRVYLADLSQAERDAIALNINLDSVGGAAHLTALCSGFPALGDFVRATCAEAGLPFATYLPLMENSDHANFAAHGIPALRLVAGFDDPASNLRHVLTAADTRDKVQTSELRMAALIAAELAWKSLTDPNEAIQALRQSI